jgi:dipeptidyl aminopeptidase/acylaminoacyl peptidase
VQAAACFFPPTDFLNYGEEGRNGMGKGVLEPFQAAFRFVELSPKTHAYEPITDEKKLEEIGKAISPIYHVNKDTAPTLIIHGDADMLVPYEQGARMVEKLRDAGVDTKLVTMKGAGHGPDDLPKRMKEIADWFDGHLQKKPDSFRH